MMKKHAGSSLKLYAQKKYLFAKNNNWFFRYAVENIWKFGESH